MCWAPYVLGPLCAGPLMCWAPYVLGPLCAGPLMCWAPYVLGPLCAGPLMCWAPYVLSPLMCRAPMRLLMCCALLCTEPHCCTGSTVSSVYLKELALPDENWVRFEVSDQ